MGEAGLAKWRMLSTGPSMERYFVTSQLMNWKRLLVMRDVVQAPRGEVVEAEDLVPPVEEEVAEVGADETGPAGDQSARHRQLIDQGQAGARLQFPPLLGPGPEGDPDEDVEGAGGDLGRAGCRERASRT